MAFLKKIIFPLAVLVTSASQVLGHGTITAVAGANGVNAAGFGIIASTPRDGTTRRPFQQDTSVIDDKDISKGRTGVCGKTLAGGNNDVQTQLTAAVNAGLPTTNADGQLTMTLHQINGDGAGPYTCDVSTDGGVTFTPATVTTNVPGNNGRSGARAQDFPLVMQVSTTTACKGGSNGDACIARCRNPARAGPFGSCVAFAMGTGDANNTTSTNTTSTTAASTTTTAINSTASITNDNATDTGATEAEALGNDPGNEDEADAGEPEDNGKGVGVAADVGNGAVGADVGGVAATQTNRQVKRAFYSRIVGRTGVQWLDV